MKIEKHHCAGLALAIHLAEQSADTATLTVQLKRALDAARTAEGLAYEEILEKLAEQENELEGYREQERIANQERLMAERTERIVDILFPSYHKASMKKEERPIRHPEKEWWWNGASLIESYITHQGKLHLEVSSYIGCGENERFECEVPAEWLELEDPTKAIHRWCLERSSTMREAKRQREILEAQAEIQRQASRLAQLQNPSK